MDGWMDGWMETLTVDRSADWLVFIGYILAWHHPRLACLLPFANDNFPLP